MYFEFHEQHRPGATWSLTVDVCERTDEIVIFEMKCRGGRQMCSLHGTMAYDHSGLKRQGPLAVASNVSMR
jgi:hypothetical protein